VPLPHETAVRIISVSKKDPNCFMLNVYLWYIYFK